MARYSRKSDTSETPKTPRQPAVVEEPEEADKLSMSLREATSFNIELWLPKVSRLLMQGADVP